MSHTLEVRRPKWTYTTGVGAPGGAEVEAETLKAAAEATDGTIMTVEDHWPEGGLGDAVLDVFADSDVRPRVVKLAVREMPGSGSPDELLAAAGIDAEHIAAAARRLVGAAA